MKIKVLKVAGIEEAIKAMRLPMKSGDKSDSDNCWDRWNGMDETPLCKNCPKAKWTLGAKHDGKQWREPVPIFECTQNREYYPFWVVGPKDHGLSMKLIKAGSDHRKHIRLIDVWMEIKAPLYIWKEFDTYRFGVDKVSESTMHTLMNKEITVDDFEMIDSDKDFISNEDAYGNSYLNSLNICRVHGDFASLNALLPQSYLQTRIVKVSYEALRNMYHARKNHKLKEWHQFCEVLEQLPYSEFITE